MLYGSNAIQDLTKVVMKKKLKHLLLITDPGLIETGLANKVLHTFKNVGLNIEIYDGVHPNPIEEDVTAGVTAFKSGQFEALVALGGGSAMDVAKTIRFMAVHSPPLSQYWNSARETGSSAGTSKPMPPNFRRGSRSRCNTSAWIADRPPLYNTDHCCQLPP